ncbi:MAG: S8 family serine peptidase [Acidimicrobiia bacterium]
MNHGWRLRGAVVAAALVFLTAGVPMAAAEEEPPRDAPFTAVPDEYLIKLSPAEAESEGLIVIRSVGFGWSLVQAPETAASADARLFGSTDPRLEPNLIYSLFEEPRFPEQWALENTGQTGGSPDADIDIRGAWYRTVGLPSTVIAIIDSGVDLDHPDLSSQPWTNLGEIPGNGIDDDDNGYVDDVHGWDAIDNDGDPDDELWHGSAVAGVAAAAVNSVGVAGVAPGVMIMPVRVCDSSCPVSAIVEGVYYAIANGARILNLSLGSHSPSPALRDALAAADAVGAVVIAAAGNDGSDNDVWPTYPASYDLPNILAVAATDDQDDLASGSGWSSSYGANSVDLAAPGGNVLTTFSGGWAEASGTSFAAPHVAGTAALIRSLRPSAEPASVRDLILRSIDDIPELDGTVATGGRLNAAGAVTLATAPIAVATAIPSGDTVPFTAALDGTESYDPLGTIVDYTWHLPGGATANGPTAALQISEPGSHSIELVVTDDEGFVGRTDVTIQANATPTAVASGSPTLGWTPLAVDVSADGSSDPDGTIVAWNWTSGTSEATGENTTILATEIGRHTITLRVTDDFGATASDTFDVLVGADFIDARTSVFRLDIAWMSALGITRGCNPPLNDHYCPTGRVTRGQMAAFLTRALDLPPTSTDYFTDDDGSLFENDINSLAAAGITTGCNPPANDRYCPVEPVRRDEMAAFLHRADS